MPALPEPGQWKTFSAAFQAICCTADLEPLAGVLEQRGRRRRAEEQTLLEREAKRWSLRCPAQVISNLLRVRWAKPFGIASAPGCMMSRTQPRSLSKREGATMKESLRAAPAELSATTFSCHATNAKSVFLAGTFNGWDPTVTPMQKNDDGEWSIQLTLAPGLYEYKFVVDGEWCCEPGQADLDTAAPDCVPNSFGTMNRQLHIG